MPGRIASNDSLRIHTALPTDEASTTLLLRQLFARRGLDLDAIEAEAHGQQPLAVVDRIDALLAGALARLGDSTFGLDAARVWHPSYFGVLGHAWLVSPTLADGLQRIADYYALVGERGTFDIERDATGVTVRFWGHRGNPASLDVAAVVVDIVLAVLIDMCRYNAGDALRPLRVTLRRRRPEGSDAHALLFGCPVEFESSENSVTISAEDARRPLSVGNRRLASLFDRLLADELAQARREDVVAHCRAVIAHRLPSGRFDAAGVAGALHLTPRTLQRRLATAGTSFQRLLDDVRRNLALDYLDDLRRPLTEVAFLLGFRELSSFTRAFRRWAACTPSHYRARLPALAGDSDRLTRPD